MVSTLALFIALGGVSYAATQLPKNSVGSRQIKPQAVTLSKVAPAAREALQGGSSQTGPSGRDGAQGPRGERGPAGPTTVTPRTVRWLAYRTVPNVEADYPFGKLVIRTIGTADFVDLCRTGPTTSPATIVFKSAGGSDSVWQIPAGDECYGYYSPPAEFEVSALGSRVFATRPDDGAAGVWELLGYDTVE